MFGDPLSKPNGAQASPNSVRCFCAHLAKVASTSILNSEDKSKGRHWHPYHVIKFDDIEWCDLNKQRIFYSNWAKAHVLQLMQHKGVTYGDLANELRAHGVVLDRHALTNKLNRGTYSFTFALQVFAALDEMDIPIPKLPAELRRSKHAKAAHSPED